MISIIVTIKKYVVNIWNGLSKLLFLNILFFLTTIPVQAWFTAQINLITVRNNLGVFFGIGAALNALLESLPSALHLLLFAVDVLAFGPACVGIHAVTSRIVRGDPVWVWPDLKKSIHENWKQAMIVGIADILVFFASLNYFISDFGGIRSFWIVLVLMYLCVRVTVYEIMFRMELSFFDLIKDALLIGLLSIWRVALLIIISLCIVWLCGYIDMFGYPLFVFALIDVIATVLIQPKVQQYLFEDPV